MSSNTFWHSKWHSKPVGADFWKAKIKSGMPMCAQATRLSEFKVKSAKPAEKDYVLFDSGGLQMRVRSNGSKLWNFNYRHPVTKKRINMGLGTFPEVSLAQARKGSVEAREALAHGIDPKEKRDAVLQAKQAATEHTLSALIEN